MTCINCGQIPASGDYTLRFLARRNGRDVELPLCDNCCTEILAEPEVELVAT